MVPSKLIPPSISALLLPSERRRTASESASRWPLPANPADAEHDSPTRGTAQDQSGTCELPCVLTETGSSEPAEADSEFPKAGWRQPCPKPRTAAGSSD